MVVVVVAIAVAVATPAAATTDGARVRLKEIAVAQQRLLHELTGRISNRLESEFRDLPGADGPNIGIALHERGRKVVMEIPGGLLLQAAGDATVREALRVRIKARRDRMLFRPPPSPLPKRIASAPDPAAGRFGFGFGGGQNRGRGRGRR